jgi:hypothetical protein
MATIVEHCGIRIVTLSAGELASTSCRPGDIAITEEADGWWTNFIDEDGAVDRYDTPFSTHHQALCAARAAAEYNLDQ